MFTRAAQVLVATVWPSTCLHCRCVCLQVLLALWNKKFDWGVAPFHFVEVFSDDGQCARAWLLVTCMHVYEILPGSGKASTWLQLTS